MSAETLPPLPDPKDWGLPDYAEAYGRACADAAIERCALECERVASEVWGDRRSAWEEMATDGCDDCASAIRALKEGQP